MGCQCSKIPANIRIIRVKDGEVGIIDLMQILREVCFLGIENESVLKEELLRKAREKNHIESAFEDNYKEALLREYLLYSQTHKPVTTSARSKNKARANPVTRLWRTIFFKRR